MLCYIIPYSIIAYYIYISGMPLIIVATFLGIHIKKLKTFADQGKVHINQTSSVLKDGNGYVNILDERNRV